MATMATGVPREKVYPMDIDAAYASLAKIKPDIDKWWTAGAMLARLLNDNEVVMATAWYGRIYAIQQAGAKVAAVWKDGLLRTDARAIPKGAADRLNAQKFAAFITMGGPQARLCRLIPYGFVNSKAAALIPADRLAQLPTAPDALKDLLIHNTQWWADDRDAALARWNKFLLG